jgi:photosystem II stability/assembly factor-like uncharacterized protein
MRDIAMTLRTLSFISTVTLLAANTARGQIDWIQQSPYPADVDLHAVWFITPEHGFISGADDLLMQTTDGGQTWTQTPSIQRSPQFLEDPIWDIQFVDSQNGFAAGNFIYRTTDGGATWQNLGSQGTYYGVEFITPQVGYLHSNLAVIKTTNAGASWDLVWDWQNFDPVSDIDFIDENTGLLAGSRDDQPGVFRTTNGGQSWDRISNQALTRILHVAGDVVIGARNASFYRSTDGGETWSPTFTDESEANNLMEALRRIDEDSFAAIDINARIWISNDAGQTWMRTFGPHGNWGFEWDIRFADSDTGYAVGRLGLIFKTTDGGQTWTQISNGAAATIEDIEVLPSGVGIAVGTRGTILRTENSGREWVVLPQVNVNGISADLETVEGVDEDTFVAAGAGFFRSDDAGQTWTQGGVLPGTDCHDLSFINDDEGWAFGTLNAPNGFIARTINGGASWQRVPDDGSIPVTTRGKVMPSGRGWALFPQTEQVITDQGFTPESFIARSFPNGDSWQEFDFATDDVGWYGGFFGGVLKSDNGGFIFEPQDLPGFRHGSGADTDRLTDVQALSADEAYISILKQGAIYDGVIYQTLDGGDNWEPLNAMRSDTNQFAGALTAISVVSAERIWALGARGSIFASDESDPHVPADLNGDGTVNVLDLLLLLDAWGACNDCDDCPADLNGDCSVSVLDLLMLLDDWG